MSRFLGEARMKHLSVGTLALAAAMVSHSTSVRAQGSAAADDSSAVTLAEVVVTAEKRSTSAQSTAIALNVFDAGALQESGVGDIGQLATIAPTINFGQNAGATTIALRGVSSRDITEIGDPAVAINVDGIFLQRPTGMNASFYDIERIEVLRGPQGTLYGRNATGGVINIITAKPTQTLGGYAAVTAGNYDTINAEGAVNLPLTSTLAMRASFITRSHEGYRNNGSAGHGDDEDAQGGRLQFLYQPTDRFSLLLSGSYLQQGGIGPVYDGIPFTSTQTVPPTDANKVDNFALSTRGDFDVKRLNAVVQADYDFDFATLTYLGGYVGLDFKHLWDNDGQRDKFFDYDRDEVSDDYSHELRLASNNKHGFVWQTGVYYYDQSIDLNNNFLLSPNPVPVSVREYHFDIDSESYAAFGQASFDLTDQLKISAGVRYSKDEKSRTGFSYVGSLTQDVSSGTAVRAFSTENSSASSDKVTWHTGLDYQLTPDNLLYAKVDTGYKSGGFTIVAPYDPETLTAYELGSKNRFLGGTLQANFSAFYYDYENQQVTQFISSGPLTGQSTVLNAGASEIYGAEAETTWLMSDADKIDFSVAYLSAEFTDFSVANGASNLSLAGNDVIQSPEWSLGLGYEHSFMFAGGTLTPRVQSQYRSSSYLTFYNRPNDRQEAYTLTDLSLGYARDDKSWSVQAYVRNVENTLVLTNADQGGPYAATRYQFGAPRTFGLRLQVNW
jgi:iron complex outermembrane receptor protein